MGACSQQGSTTTCTDPATCLLEVTIHVHTRLATASPPLTPRPRFVFQGVHMLMQMTSSAAGDVAPWKDGEPRVNKIVFIGEPRPHCGVCVPLASVRMPLAMYLWARLFLSAVSLSSQGTACSRRRLLECSTPDKILYLAVAGLEAIDS